MLFKFVTALALSAPLFATPCAVAGTVRIYVETPNGHGKVRVAIYRNSSDYADSSPSFAAIAKAKPGRNQYIFLGIEPGSYGIAVFQDVNENGRLDRNLLGIPLEPFGFSLNPQIGFAAPDFEEFSFSLDEETKEFSIILNGS